MSISVDIIEWDMKYVDLKSWLARLNKAIFDNKIDTFVIQGNKYILVDRFKNTARFIPEGHDQHWESKPSKKYPRRVSFVMVFNHLLQSFAINPESIISDIKKIIIKSL